MNHDTGPIPGALLQVQPGNWRKSDGNVGQVELIGSVARVSVEEGRRFDDGSFWVAVRLSGDAEDPWIFVRLGSLPGAVVR